ncbi:hypothetical protein G6F50_015727 [Rhizopus delemar]|uniref:Uncharacterized protein n=1 Tax=Rhizopus delemar TaxID=936053 RepID=A0A9P6XX59_9FUNG|nr:hypothetical protein G6F50_015727 [Rhizopus delemar]
MEAALVVHLLVAADPVAQVDVRQALAAGPFDLLQDREGTQPARGVLRVEEGVDRRQAVLGDVGHRHSQQLAGLAVVAGQAHLHEAGVRPAADQELLELVRAVVVHAAVGEGRIAIDQHEGLRRRFAQVQAAVGGDGGRAGGRMLTVHAGIDIGIDIRIHVDRHICIIRT